MRGMYAYNKITHTLKPNIRKSIKSINPTQGPKHQIFQFYRSTKGGSKGFVSLSVTQISNPFYYIYRLLLACVFKNMRNYMNRK